MPSATSYPISPCGEPDGVGLPDRHGSPNGYGSPDGYGRPDGHGYPDGHGSVDGHESPNGHRSLAGHEGSDGDSDSPALAGISSSTKRPHRHSSPETFPPHPRSIGLRGSPTPIPPFSSSSQPNKHRLDPPLSQKISPASEAYPARTPRSNSGSGQSGEDTLTLRRREANRLAAQRFRSRKKGYQDSLEERVRQLEDERDALLHRLGEVPGPSSRGTLGIGFDEDAYDPPGPQHTRPMAASPTSRTVPQSHFSARSASPERLELSIDNDIRTAALEAANRKLQDKLRRIADENERMGAEIERWQRWERDQRECQPWKYAFRESDQRTPSAQRPDTPMTSDALRGQDTCFDSSRFSASLATPASHSPLQSTKPQLQYHRPASPGIHLPPLRLPSFHRAISVDGHTSSSVRTRIRPRPMLDQPIPAPSPSSSRQAPMVDGGRSMR